jgi:hypothetical protein
MVMTEPSRFSSLRVPATVLLLSPATQFPPDWLPLRGRLVGPISLQIKKKYRVQSPSGSLGRAPAATAKSQNLADQVLVNLTRGTKKEG